MKGMFDNNGNFWLTPKKLTVSGIPSGRQELYEKALAQTTYNKKNSKIKYGLKFDIADLEEEFKNDMKNDDGFIIDTSIDYEKLDSDRNILLSSDSIFSYKFGYRSDDPKIVQAKRCSCRCGKVVSSIPGGTCPICGTLIKPVQKLRGWISLEGFYVFNPTWLERFFKYLKKGAPITASKFKEKSLFNYKSDRPYYNILDLQPTEHGPSENLISMINACVQPELRDYFIKNAHKAMTSKIPVISKEFRHYDVAETITGKADVRTHEFNKHYIIISNKANAIAKEFGKIVPHSKIIRYLKEIQHRFDEIANIAYDEIGEGKESTIRGKTIAKRVDNSTRLIIEGLTKYGRLDVMTLPFKVFGEMTIGPYIDIYKKYGATPESLSRMRSNIPNKFDKEMMCKVLKELQSKMLNYALTYRPPCIYLLSQVVLEIVGLTEDHSQVIFLNTIMVDGCLRGDFDGDQVGSHLVHALAAAPVSFALNPKRMTYDPITGEFNSEYNLIEGHYIAVYKVLDSENSKLKDDDIMTEAEFKALALNSYN